MADIKISELTSAIASNDTDLFETSQSDGMGGWISKKVSKSQIISGSTSEPNNIFWVSLDANPGGNGSITAPFITVSAAYAAGVTSGTPFIIVLNPGFYDESANDYVFVSGCTFFGFDENKTEIKFGNLTLDQTSWTTIGSQIASIGFRGLTISAISLELSVPSLSDGRILMRDIIAKAIASETWKFSGFSGVCDFADCNFVQLPTNFYGSFVKGPGCYWGDVVASTYDVDTIVSIGNGRFEGQQRMSSLTVKANGGDTQNVYVDLLDPSSFSVFSTEGDTINVFKAANIQDPTIISGTPTITNIDKAANIFASDTRTNYTPTSDTVEGNFQGIDTALAAAGGMSIVIINSGYQLVADNTLYIIADTASGKTFFQTPPTMAAGFRFEIMGAGGNPISNWNLNTQLNQSLINGADITNIGADRYAILEPSSPTDRVSFVCTLANQDVSVEFSSSAGLTLFEQVQVSRDLFSQTAASPRALYAMGQVDSAYTGYLLQIQRDSDSATAFVSPDLAYRPSPLSALDIGGNVASWGYGANVNIIAIMDQSGNVQDASGGASWIDSAGNVVAMASTNNTAMYFSGGSSMQATLTASYTASQLNVFSLSQQTALVESAIVDLYDPANGDDFGSSLNCIAFQVPPPETDVFTYRNGNLSTKPLPAQNTRLLLATNFDGANNILVLNGAAGSPVSSSGAFSFNKVLLSARYVSGSITHLGNFKTACAFVYPNMSGGDFAAIQSWIDGNL